MIKTLLIVVLLAGCGFEITGADVAPDAATAPDGALDGTADAAVDAPLIDAPPIDVPLPIAFTLTQTAPDVAANAGAGCNTGFRRWYRVFRLADHGLAAPITVSSVSFWVHRSINAPSIAIRVGTYGGLFNASAFQISQFTVLGTGSTAAPDLGAPGQLVAMPLASPAMIPAGATLVAVELAAPAGGTLDSGSIGDPVEPHGFFLSDSCGVGGTTPQARTSGVIVTVSGVR
jgi:hypothetical protein